MRRLVLLATVLTPAVALAQTPTTLPDTVVTATRVPTPAERVPAAITVITRETIQERGYQTLAEALRSVPGFTMIQSGGLGQQASGFVRGANSNQVTVLLDGVVINDPSTPAGAFNFGNDLLGDIERIEVLRGPASALYGSSAIGGVVNMITRRAPADKAFHGFGELAGGTQDTARGTIGGAGTIGIWDYMAALQGLSTRGSNAVAPRFPNRTSERDGFQGAAGTARLGVTPVEGLRLEGLLRWRENHLDLDSVPYDDPNYTGNDRRFSGQLRGTAVLLDGAWTTGLRVAQTEDRRSYRNLMDAGSRATTDDLFRGSRTTYEWTNTVRLPDAGIVTDPALSFGLTHAREAVDQNSGSPSFRTTTNATATQDAAQAALQFRLLERLDIAAGLRRDEYEGFDEATTWRLGGVFAIPEAATRLRAAAGSGFKAPSLYERFGRIGTYFRGNPNLRPEYSESWEIGSETDLPVFGRPDGLTLGVTYFDTRSRDLINYDTTYSTLVNVDRARIKGLEWTATARISPEIELTGAWTITDARNARTEERLLRRPENQWSLSARLVPMPKVVISPEVLVVGRTRDSTYDDSGNFLGAAENKAGTILNISATYAWNEAVTFFTEGRNLGNSRYEPANGFVVPGRSLLVGTRFVF